MQGGGPEADSRQQLLTDLNWLLEDLDHLMKGLQGAYSDTEQASLEVDRMVVELEKMEAGWRKLETASTPSALELEGLQVLEDLTSVTSELSDALEGREVEQTRILSQAVLQRWQRLQEITRDLRT